MKTVLITGASSGIGRAIAKVYAQSGNYRLILCGRRINLLNQLKEDLKNLFNTEVIPLCFDIRSFDACKNAIQTLAAPLGNNG
jgi:3-hydroxy acid dehydrogenase / malonic semialdehyde reductase